MNSNQIYQEILKLDKVDTTAEQLEVAKQERDKLVAWSNWNLNPQTQEFKRILTEEQSKLLLKSMRLSNGGLTPSFLVEANTLDKILNSVMQNGKYENPT
jgi:hypothetical protein